MNGDAMPPEIPERKRPPRARGPVRTVTEAERVASETAIRDIAGKIMARARGLRRLSYVLLAAIIILLGGGLGVLFYSQLLLIQNSSEQSAEIKKKQEQIDKSTADLELQKPEFVRRRQDVAGMAAVAKPPIVLEFNYLRSVQFAADGKRGWAVGDKGTILSSQNGGETWQSQTSGTTNDLLSVQFAADGKRGWAVGKNGTILRLDPLDVTTLNDTIDLKSVQAALTALGISDLAIGSPMKLLEAFETNRDQRRAEIQREQTDLQNRKTNLQDLLNVKHDPMEIYFFVARFSFAVVLFFLVSILVSVYRYSLRLAAHYDARADALGLSNALLDRRFHQLVRSLAPSGVDFGKMDRAPTQQALDVVRNAVVRRGSN